MINKLKENIYQLYFRRFGSTVYLIELKDKLILIDTSSTEARDELQKDLEQLNIKPTDVTDVIITHDHWDHVGNNDLFTEAKFFDFNNLEELKQAFPEFTIIETPGHKEDSICILYEEILFSGDTIFHHGGVGRTDLPGGDQSLLIDSIKKLQKIPFKILAPGHI